MKYYVVAGERSGDLHAGNLIQEIHKLDLDAAVRGFGGEYLEKAGAEISVHYRELAFMGFFEVIKNLSTIKKYLSFCKDDIKKFSPDVVILIDYAGFNLKIAKYVNSLKIPVYYYISPKVWAWNQKRALKLKKRVDHLFSILPFEKEFFRKFDWEVDYVGNPVLDAVKDHNCSKTTNTKLVALLPGSRKQELHNILPKMAELAQSLPDYQFRLATVDNLPKELYEDILGNRNVIEYEGSTYDLLSEAHVAVVASGTATLETALFQVPQVVVYKTSNISYRIAKMLIQVPYISLVNLVANKEVVKELIQNDLNTDSLSAEVTNLMTNESYRASIIDEYKLIKENLDIGRASANAALLMVKYLKEKKRG